jgi:hypothetical protein
MKISELIDELETYQKVAGDIEVRLLGDVCGDPVHERIVNLNIDTGPAGTKRVIIAGSHNVFQPSTW